MRILIVRHGDPDYVHDTLTEKGHREAELLAEKLKREKIDYFYCSPLGRAKDTCAHVVKAMGREKDVVVLPWLREFDHALVLPSGEERPILWDMLPSFWTKEDKMYDAEKWLEQDFYVAAGMREAYLSVTRPLDELLKKHGYAREGRLYKTERGNRDTVAFFCHFGLEMILLSHLLHISPVVLTHNFVAQTSSVTTLYTEERREGIASLRCASFGDIGHLYAGNEPPSLSARFCEVYHSDERHD